MMKFLTPLYIVISMLVLTACGKRHAAGDGIIFESDELLVTADSVTEGPFTAKALSATEIVTDYRLPADTATVPSVVRFRFALNARDNELPPGVAHTTVITPGRRDSTVYTFGRVTDTPAATPATADTMRVNAPWTVTLDLRPVLRSFRDRGYYVGYGGDTIYTEDFRGVWITGNVSPLDADPSTLTTAGALRLNAIGDSTYVLALRLNPPRPPAPRGWRADSLPSRFATYSSDQVMIDALYNRSLDLLKAGFSDSMPLTDLAYSIYISGALLDPDASARALRVRLRDGMIADSAWPLRTDRAAWALAAWEVYKVNGDRRWLAEAADAVEKTLRHDADVSLDSVYTLMHGAGRCPCPAWMDVTDRYEMFDLETNVLTARAWELLAHMVSELGRTDDAVTFRANSVRLREAINDRLWMPVRGYYSSYLYGGFYPVQAPGVSAAGQAMAVLSGIATPEMASTLVTGSPRVADASPTVRALQCMAAATTLNLSEIRATAASIIRSTALLSDTLSPCAVPAVALRVLAGIHVDEDGITFRPVIPPFMSGDKVIRGLAYRNAVLDITIRGTGSTVAAIRLDGSNFSGKLPATLSGRHSVDIVMAGNTFPDSEIASDTAWTDMPPVPSVSWQPPRAEIANYSDTVTWQLYLNGILTNDVTSPAVSVPLLSGGYNSVSLLPVSDSKTDGFTMRPLTYFPPGSLSVIQPELNDSTGTYLIADEKIASRFVMLGPVRNNVLTIDFGAPADGLYLIDLCYANGGPTAMRSLTVNGVSAGHFIMPRRGLGEWHKTGYSSYIPVRLKAGPNELTITGTDLNAPVLLDYIRLIQTLPATL